MYLRSGIQQGLQAWILAKKQTLFGNVMTSGGRIDRSGFEIRNAQFSGLSRFNIRLRVKSP
jgi:hypothetical protein